MIRGNYRSRSRRPWKVKHWLVFFVCVAAFAGLVDLLTLPSVADLRTVNPATTAIIQARIAEAQRVHRPFAVRQQWVRLKSISPALRRAIVIAEDGNFFSHGGFDFAEMWYALRDALLEFDIPRGASTISQQLAKNLFLSESKNPWRKAREAALTWKLESALSKERILELYVNVIELGDGIFGVEAAAQHYFGVPAALLSTDQAAFLASIIPNPRTVYNPKQQSARVERRKALILRRMARAQRQ